MSGRLPLPIRVLGLWLLYTFVGFILLLLALAAGDPGTIDTRRSPTGWAAKIVGALSAVPLSALAIGMWLVNDPSGNAEAANALIVGGAVGSLVFAVTSWILITRDLRGRSK